MGKREGKGPFGRHRYKWDYNIKWIFRKWDLGIWTGSAWLRIGRGRHLECGNEPSDSIKCCEILEALIDCFSINLLHGLGSN